MDESWIHRGGTKGDAVAAPAAACAQTHPEALEDMWARLAAAATEAASRRDPVAGQSFERND
jgi:hypothetical protein